MGPLDLIVIGCVLGASGTVLYRVLVSAKLAVEQGAEL